MNEQAHRTKDRLSQGGPSFAETLQGYLKEVAEMERLAEQQVVSLAQGEATNVHQVMLAVEEANLALDLLIQIRNRLLDAYKELSATSI
ncbi:MAG: flagellar hook-basal body complex protein FliE [Candidatus Eisenbacteria sp.]|nr:flagellar hook-basal body complex protein FliE [Candidatus Eisenbacteria bacterium]